MANEWGDEAPTEQELNEMIRLLAEYGTDGVMQLMVQALMDEDNHVGPLEREGALFLMQGSLRALTEA
jgi:hypothetical protein